AIGKAEAGSVAPCYIQRSFGNVGGVNGGSGKLVCQSDGNATGAGANIHDDDAFPRETRMTASADFAHGEAVERNFDEMLGFRARDEHIGRNLELQAPEFLFAGEMLRGHSRRAA